MPDQINSQEHIDSIAKVIKLSQGRDPLKLRWIIPTLLLLVWIGILVAFGAVEPAAPKGATDPSPHVCVIP